MPEVKCPKYGGVWDGRYLLYLEQFFYKIKFTLGLQILRWLIVKRIKSIERIKGRRN